MEAITTWLIGGGGILISLSFLLGVVELATLRTIRPPERRTFSYIRLAATQYQTVFAPAMGALISGLFVSLSASFFYAALIGQRDSWHQSVGSILFITGAVALAITMRSFLKDVGEPAELARDPFTIRAAAEESAADPRRGSLDPDALTQQLNEWVQYISARSMNLSVKTGSAGLDQSLTAAAQTRTFWSSILRSFQVYSAAVRRFPFRFGWPIVGFVLFATETVWFAASYAGFDSTTSMGPLVAVGLLVSVGAVVTAFYCVVRGNRARLWHRVNLVALDEARKAIDAARAAHESVAAQDALLERVLTRADAFLLQEQAASSNSERVILRLGKFHLSVIAAREHRRGQ